MNKRLREEFLAGTDTLRVYEGTALLYASRKQRLLALLDFIDCLEDKHHGVTILDRIMGNAAALLSIRAGCGEVYSPLGSQLAVITLDRYGIRHQLDRIIPFIRRDSGDRMCPMERLSVDKTPEEFYTALKSLASDYKSPSSVPPPRYGPVWRL